MKGLPKSDILETMVELWQEHQSGKNADHGTRESGIMSTKHTGEVNEF